MILTRLKEATSMFHNLAENLNFSQEIFNGSFKAKEYAILLKRMHCLFKQASVLHKFHGQQDIIPLLFFEQKSDLLQQDINKIDNAHLEDLTAYHQNDYFEHLGFCYVALGSMLGGQVIKTQIGGMKMLPYEQLPTCFYDSCKQSLMDQWRPFCSYLESIHEEDHTGIINGAITAYLYFIYLCARIKD